MNEKGYGNLVLGNIDRSAGECLRFRHNKDGAWFEYVPPQYTGENVKIFKLDNPAVVHSLKQMLEGIGTQLDLRSEMINEEPLTNN